MAPQHGGRKDEEVDDDETIDQTNSIDDEDLYPSSTTFMYTEIMKETQTPTITGFPAERTDFGYPWKSNKFRHTKYSVWPPEAASSEEAATSDISYSQSIPTPLQDGGPSASSSTPTPIDSYTGYSSSTTTATESGGRRSEWKWQQKHSNNAPLYAAAAVVPVVLLAIVGLVVFLCLRKRKRRKQDNDAAQMAAHEMKKQQQVNAQPYMAPPPPVAAPQYVAAPSELPPTSTPYQLQPIILGPIPSGSNGAYLTGMDTSDVVSIRSNNLRPADPFADSSSLAEPPPPPYRPASAAPPSFMTTSRQSSVRTSAPPASSQTLLLERSPFDDPRADDSVSELSGPTMGRTEDAMSAVSDLSYQHDPFADRRHYDQ